MKTSIAFVSFSCCAILFALQLTAQTGEPFINTDTVRYSVSIAAESKRVAKVNASFQLHSNLVSMFVSSTKELPDGQAAFVKNFSVTDARGKALPFKYKGEGDWEITAKPHESVRLSYEVHLEHDKHAWAGGADETAFATEDAVYYAGSSLFIVPDAQAKNVLVEWRVPAGWKVSTPWKRMQGKPNVFYVPRAGRPLTTNCVMVGTHEEDLVKIGDFELRLAISGKIKSVKPMFVETITPVLRSYSAMFGGAPAATSYLVVVSEAAANDGEAFADSFTVLINGAPDKLNSVVWAHGMAHEVFHLWNGVTVQPASASEEWFKEGFTDYMTVVCLRRLGIIDETLLFKKLENSIRKYVLAGLISQVASQATGQPPRKESLRKAGENKGANRLLIYGGGAVVALALDAQMRDKTDGKKGVDDLMRALYEEFGKSGKKYALADIIRIANALAGANFSEFFAKYVEGTEGLDIEPYLAKIGLRISGFVEEIYIGKKEPLTEREQILSNSIFGQR